MRLKLLVGLVICGSSAAIGCLDDSITGTRALMIEISVDPTVASVNEVVTAHYSVEGTGVIGVIVNWGDGMLDSIPYPGVVEAAGPIAHQYEAVGTYDIVGTVEAQNGALSAQTTIQVN